MHDSKLENADPPPLPPEQAVAPASMAVAEIAAAEPTATGALDEPPDAPNVDAEPPDEPAPVPAAPEDVPDVDLPSTPGLQEVREREGQALAEPSAAATAIRTTDEAAQPDEPAPVAAAPEDIPDVDLPPAPSPRLGGESAGEGQPRQDSPGAASALLNQGAEAHGTSPQQSPTRLANWKPRLARLARYAALALAGWLALVVVLVALFRFVDPPGSMLMLLQRLGGTPITMSWRDFDDISPELVRAVVASEDSRICEHWGIDLDEIANAIRRTRDGTPRGASTISMQVAKNLFLWPSKSYLRKVLEVPVTLAIELIWPKRRIVEVYLNIAEWGPGVFGAEAAARHHFAKPAKRLSARESALLAVSLPNPALRSAGKPSRMLSRLASLIERRAKALGSATRCLAP